MEIWLNTPTTVKYLLPTLQLVVPPYSFFRPSCRCGRVSFRLLLRRSFVHSFIFLFISLDSSPLMPTIFLTSLFRHQTSGLYWPYVLRGRGVFRPTVQITGGTRKPPEPYKSTKRWWRVSGTVTIHAFFCSSYCNLNRFVLFLRLDDVLLLSRLWNISFCLFTLTRQSVETSEVSMPFKF